jgi:chemosensory pili system protein ChpA (sensor histidine kinase/response regulator)
MMAESLHDLSTVQQTLSRNLGEIDAAVLQQARVGRELQQGLMRTRTIPFANLEGRLYRIARQTARELDKKIQLDISDSHIELDRSVLERIGAPLEHLLRNAIGHGIESPEARRAAGKPEAGEISIALRQESNEIAIVIRDDGAGLDLDKLRAKGIEKGLLDPTRAATPEDLGALIFAPGLSTADSVTELAGRGVGMDVVRSEITAIGGHIDTASVSGKGTTFSIFLPLTLAVAQAVLVRAGSGLFAISSAMVEQVLRVQPDALAVVQREGRVRHRDADYPLHDLGALLGERAVPATQGYNTLLLLRSGTQRIALQVDELIRNQEIVVKHLSPQLARVPGVTGATVLGDGRVVLIINPVPLTQRALPAARIADTPLPTPAAPTTAPMVMVVDDSLTVRKVTGRLLEREGYRVLAAKDGVDALEQIKAQLPDLMLVDIEMPRMDGFELAMRLRQDARTAAVPIVIISSRTADKHRSRAQQIGVNAFLGKPYQEAEILAQLARYAPRREQQPAAAAA